MIDLKKLDKDFDNVAEKLKRRGVDKELLLELKNIFIERKKNINLIETNKAEQNKITKQFGEYLKGGKDINTLKENINTLKEQVAPYIVIGKELDIKLEELNMYIPNIPDDNVPDGVDENDNVEIKKVLVPKTFDFEVKNHWDLENGWLDFKRGTKLAGSRFTVLRGVAPKLERALINFFLDKNASLGFEEVSVPYIVNKDMLIGTGQYPKFKDDLYKMEGDEMYLIPTAEVPLTNIFNDEILEVDELPILVTAATACFRKEAGAAGRDTRGIIRQHQFNKVEMVAITTPEQSDKIFEIMVENASNILSELELPHRVVRLCTGDLGFSAQKTVDLEVWLPGEGKYREISSISNTGDFQARRAKIRYKNGKKNELVNTLNGSALAVGRTIVAIMENYQNEDGSITIPKVLQKYM